MAIYDNKLKKMLEKTAQLDKRIKDDSAKRKQLQMEIDLLSYENLKTELAKNGMSIDEYVIFVQLKKKMNEKNVSMEDVLKMLDIEEENDEKKIF